MRAQFVAAARVLVACTILVGVLYPLAVLGVGQVALSHRADGSIVTVDGRAVGSSLIGQASSGPRWFHPRPSATGYGGTDSGASNLGPSNPTLIGDVRRAAAAYRRENGLAQDVRVPVDAVTSSGSGLDPHISVANARLQAGRVAAARGLPRSRVLAAIGPATDGRSLGVFGEPAVNVLRLNLAVEALSRQT